MKWNRLGAKPGVVTYVASIKGFVVRHRCESLERLRGIVERVLMQAYQIPKHRLNLYESLDKSSWYIRDAVTGTHWAQIWIETEERLHD